MGVCDCFSSLMRHWNNLVSRLWIHQLPPNEPGERMNLQAERINRTL